MGGSIGSLRVLAAIVLWSGLSACSVGMALSGEENPDLGAVRIGAQRGEIELHLGAPVQTVSLENGRRADIYEYQIGNQPSAGRRLATA